MNLADSLFQNGDLIFREGRGVISAAFKRFSLKDPAYSHAGIIHAENNQLFVYHVLGGEANPDGKIKKELLQNFIHPLQAHAYAIYRFDMISPLIDSLAGIYYSKNIQFDREFSLASDDKMYCTEFLYKVLITASGNDNFIPLSEISGARYVACDNIYLAPYSHLIYSYKY